MKFDRSVGSVSAAMLLSLACALTAREPTATPPPESVEVEAAEAAPSATSVPATETSALPTATIEHFTQPNEPPAGYLFVTDSDSSLTAPENRASGGDQYSSNRFERPFDAQGMLYRADLDLLGAEVAFDEHWLYFTMGIGGPGTASAPRAYAVELDLDADGDGDWLISASNPDSPTWTTDGVRGWHDLNDDVGGLNPMAPDSSSAAGDGYESVPFDQGLGTDPDAAWARLVLGEATEVQIAMKRTLIGGDSAFLWGAWAMESDTLAESFDLNDRFSFGQAGSPLVTSDQYPLKEIALVDNTCRMYFGFTPTSSIPGACPLPVTPTPEATPTPEVGVIYGLVWVDDDLDGVKDSGEVPLDGQTVQVREESCSGPVYASITAAYIQYGMNYRLVDVPSGTYCVQSLFSGQSTTGGNQKTVNVPPGGQVEVKFGYRPNG